MKKPIEIVNEMIELVKKSDELNKVDPETKLPGTLLDKNHEKGLHQRVSADIAAGSNPHNKNMSRAGVLSRWGNAKTTSAAKDIHKDKLQELKAMPKPNLPKSEEMAKEETLYSPSEVPANYKQPVPLNKDSHGALKKIVKHCQLNKSHEKGVHTPVLNIIEGEKSKEAVRKLKGRSVAGLSGKENEVAAHRKALAELKAMPKSNLPKSEQMVKAEDLNKVSDAQRAKGYGKTSYFSNMIAEQKAAKVGTPTTGAASTSAIKPMATTAKPTTVHHPDISGKVDYKAPKKLAASESVTPHKDTIKKIVKSCQMITKNNPDEKADAKLGENVESLVENHMLENKAAEIKEGHKIFDKDKKNG